jgi:nicotinamidase/pyrazinamidase
MGDGRGTGRVPRYAAGTALVVVDVQNDFADPAGSLYVAGGEAVVAAVNEEIAAAVQAGALVAYTQDWHPPQTPHFEKDGGVWPVHCVRETWGAAFHPDLVIADDAVFVRKGTEGEDGYSGFTMRDSLSGESLPTGLTAALVEHDVRNVVVVGLATDYCVRATALDASALGFPTAVVRSAVGAVDLQPGDGERALHDLAEAGVVVA